MLVLRFLAGWNQPLPGNGELVSRAFMKERDDLPEEIPVPPRHTTEEQPLMTVVVEGIDAGPRTLTIVRGADTDVSKGRIADDSPLAQALLGAHDGEDVVWHRPSGDRVLHVVTIKGSD